MSEYAGIRFVSNVKQEDVYKYIRKEINEQKERFQELADTYIYLCLCKFDYPGTKEELTSEEYRYLLHQPAEYLADKILGFTFLYYPKLSLLGIMGETNTGVKLEFQDSCDQDYKLQYWEGVPCLNKIVEKYEKMPDEEILKRYKMEYGEKCNDIGYYRRTFCYDEIYDLLDINLLLYNKEEFSEKYMMLSINTIEDIYTDETEWKTAYKKALNKYYEEEKNR